MPHETHVLGKNGPLQQHFHHLHDILKELIGNQVHHGEKLWTGQVRLATNR